jgi:putative ribosome biogenesis GTPase RsgA
MKTTTISDVRDFIMAASDADMVQIQFAIKYRQEAKRAAIKRDMYVGDAVKFKSAKDSGLYVATVTKIARKRAHVKVLECTNLRYPLYRVGTIVTVPMEMLNF